MTLSKAQRQIRQRLWHCCARGPTDLRLRLPAEIALGKFSGQKQSSVALPALAAAAVSPNLALSTYTHSKNRVLQTDRWRLTTAKLRKMQVTIKLLPNPCQDCHMLPLIFSVIDEGWYLENSSKTDPQKEWQSPWARNSASLNPWAPGFDPLSNLSVYKVPTF